MEFMADKPDNHWSLAIIDPPYGINAPKMQMGTNLKRRGVNQYRGESTATRLKKGRLNSGSGKLKNRILNTSDIDWDNAPLDQNISKSFSG
jgi:site-specific DNA-methyltransferase (adenine-specific)